MKYNLHEQYHNGSSSSTQRRKCAAIFICWRFFVVCGMLLCGLLMLLGRTAWLQVIQPERLVHESDRRSLRLQAVAPPRGIIIDRAGHSLAVSVPVEAIWADPQAVVQSGALQLLTRWQALAEALNLPPERLLARITANTTGRFVYLTRQVSPTVAKYVRELAIPGVHLRTESRRFYPEGEVTAHLLGFTDIDGAGIEGIEKYCDAWLTGQSAQRVVRQDGFGRVVEGVTTTISITSQNLRSQNLQLSIDGRLQLQAYRALKETVTVNKAHSGSVILVDVNSGEILALANSPSYNPNSRAGTPSAHFRNRAITDTFEPGSTVKPLVLLKALENQTITHETVVDTAPGTLQLNGHTVRDLRNYGALTLRGILQKSSNVGISKLALAMPIQTLINHYRDFGLGVATNIGLIGESHGYILNKTRWSDLERAGFSFGYGLAVTPLQLARAYATIGSFGLARPLTITKIEGAAVGQRVASETLVRQVVGLMESVAMPGGGGVRAAVPGYRIAVKTGTTRIAVKGGYSRQYISYTAGVAPITNPRLALVVVINNPKNGEYYGGIVAAPLFSSIMGNALRMLNIEPDAPPITSFSMPALTVNTASSSVSKPVNISKRCHANL